MQLDLKVRRRLRPTALLERPDIDRRRGLARIGDAAGARRDSGRRSCPLSRPARPAGRNDLPAAGAGGHDRRLADGAQEPAQPACAASWSLAWTNLGSRIGPHARGGAGAATAHGADPGRAVAPERGIRRASRSDRAGRAVPENRADRGSPRPGNFHDLRGLSGHQAIRGGHRSFAPVAERMPGSTWPRRASRSRANRASLPIWRGKGPTGCSSGMRGACGTVPIMVSRSSRISRSTRPTR